MFNSIFNKFLKDLMREADENNLTSKEKEQLKEKYKKHYSLAMEAGLSEKEAVQRFGTVENIIKQYKEAYFEEKLPDVQADSIEVDVHSDGIVTFTYSKDDKIRYKVTDETLFDIKTSDSALSIKSNFSLKKRTANIIIYVPRNLKLKSLVINTSFAKTDTAAVNLQAEKITVHTISGGFSGKSLVAQNCYFDSVSGDICVGELIADTVNASSVSGNITFNNINADTVKFFSVSGKMTISGEVNNKKASTFCGQFVFNQKKIGRNLSEYLKSVFGSKKNGDDNSDQDDSSDSSSGGSAFGSSKKGGSSDIIDI